MAIRADEITARDLLQYKSTATELQAPANVAQLRGAGQMVPLHSLCWVRDSAVRARLSHLERANPFLSLLTSEPHLSEPKRSNALVVGMVVRLSTRLAVRLVAVAAAASAVELREGLLDTTPAAALHRSNRTNVRRSSSRFCEASIGRERPRFRRRARAIATARRASPRRGRGVRCRASHWA